jgi:hypothetical protein
VNKQLGAVQTIALWAHDNGLIPDEVPWADPFSRMRLEEDDPDREPFTTAELKLLFAAPVFTKGERPVGGRGVAAFWLPLIGLFSGARQSELAGLSVADVRTDVPSNVTALFITRDRERGKRVKTRQSERAVPVHPELVKLGFLDYVQDVQRTRGDDAWLFPLIAPNTGGVKALPCGRAFAFFQPLECSSQGVAIRCHDGSIHFRLTRCVYRFSSLTPLQRLKRLYVLSQHCQAQGAV